MGLYRADERDFRIHIQNVPYDIFLAHFVKGVPHYPQKGEANIETGHWVCRLATAFLKKRCVVCRKKMGLQNEGKDAV